MRSKTFWVGLIAAAIVIAALVGCGGGGGGGATSTVGLTPSIASGRVILPPGFTGSTTGLIVSSGVDKQPLPANGTFSIKVPGGGPCPIDLLAANGKLILTGFADPGMGTSSFSGGNGEISANQTANYLLFSAIGVPLFAGNDAWTSARSLIAKSAPASTLAAVVTQRVAANPTALSDSDSQLFTAVSQQAAALLQSGKSVRQASRSSAPAVSTVGTVQVVSGRATRAGSATQLLVQPSGEQSGVELLNNPNGSGVVFVNHFRRRCAAFVYETAVQHQGDANAVPIAAKAITFSTPATLDSLVLFFHSGPLPTAFTAMEIQLANSLHGIIGSLTDLAQGAGAFTPVTSAPFDLPQDGDAIKTVYTVVVVGACDENKISSAPAFQQSSNSAFSATTSANFAAFADIWKTTIHTEDTEEVLLDILVPVIASTTIGDGAKVGNFSGEAIKELVNALINVPDLNQSIATGDYKSAISSIIQTIVDNGTVREKVIAILFSQFLSADNITSQIEAAGEKLERAFAVVSVVELTLQVVDSSAVTAASAAANPGDIWQTVVVNIPVKLSPMTSTVSTSMQTAQLTASPGVFGDPSAPYVYHWTVSGTAGGGIEDSNHTSAKDKDFDSTDNQVTYAEASTAVNGQSDTIVVQVFVNAGNLSHSARGQLLGQAQSTITVSSTGCGTGSPGTNITSGCGDFTVNSTVAVDGHLTANVTVHAGGACGNGATLSLNDIAVTSVTLDGKSQASSSVPITAVGTHVVDYQIAPGSDICSGTQVLNSDPNLFVPQIFGPWILLQEGSGGNSSGWTTQKPITVIR